MPRSIEIIVVLGALFTVLTLDSSALAADDDLWPGENRDNKTRSSGDSNRQQTPETSRQQLPETNSPADTTKPTTTAPSQTPIEEA